MHNIYRLFLHSHYRRVLNFLLAPAPAAAPIETSIRITYNCTSVLSPVFGEDFVVLSVALVVDAPFVGCFAITVILDRDFLIGAIITVIAGVVCYPADCGAMKGKTQNNITRVYNLEKGEKTNQKEKIVCIKAQPMKFYSKAVL